MTKIFLNILALALLISGTALMVFSQTGKITPTLRVYGPGGPLAPVKECAEAFARERRVTVNVVAGPESEWIERAKTDGDVIFGGAEYMLTQLGLKYPDLFDAKDRTELYPRAAGILVRRGNPKNIKNLRDLTRPGIRIIDVSGAGQLGLWEDIAGAAGLIPGISRNITLSVSTSAEVIKKWKAMPEFDAWITYESWHYRLTEVTDLVVLPKAGKIYRGTPVVITKNTNNRLLAGEFIKYMQSPKGHRIFRKWGWR